LSTLLKVLVTPGARVVVGKVVIGALVGFPETNVVVAVGVAVVIVTVVVVKTEVAVDVDE
jgi:hypothetical protein